jgi:hypothetical protein
MLIAEVTTRLNDSAEIRLRIRMDIAQQILSSGAPGGLSQNVEVAVVDQPKRPPGQP